jgi:hypothetical protein
MPKQKDLKRLVRARMKKTGESYTAARTQLTRKKTRGQAIVPPEPEAAAADFARLAGMSDEAIRAKTGCTWARWVRALDKIGAVEMPHREIARHVHETFKIDGWWAQTVTVGYERIRGLREISQRRSGSYEATKSKTFPVPVGDLYDAFAAPKRRSRWLPGVALTVRKATANRSMRIAWPDGTNVELWFIAKGDKSQVAVSHRKLVSRADVEARKKYWSERLAALAEIIEP